VFYYFFFIFVSRIQWIQPFETTSISSQHSTIVYIFLIYTSFQQVTYLAHYERIVVKVVK